MKVFPKQRLKISVNLRTLLGMVLEFGVGNRGKDTSQAG
jgi:hypothetical protein